MKVIFGKKMAVLEESRWLMVLRGKYELGNDYGSVHNWKENIKMKRNEKDWEEEISSKSTLRR